MEAKVFITEQERSDGLYEGPKILAASWSDAEIEARAMRARLVGILVEEQESETGEVTATHDSELRRLSAELRAD